MTHKLKREALVYHAHGPSGKIEIATTKPLNTRDDLALAYSPGVAYASQAIQEDPSQADRLTAKSHLVGVISNGTAVLGLGNIGALAAKPVMEGKVALFKKFGHLDAFDLELNASDPQQFIQHVRALAPTFGGINLEDIKAPDCFMIEEALQDLGIPVFHDDQHGTAVVVAAAILNGLKHVQKSLENIKLVVSGAGSAALACLKLLEAYGLNRRNTFVFDSQGLLTNDRSLDVYKKPWARPQKASLDDALKGADVFLGLSKGGILTEDNLKSLAPNPLILALANPEPEVWPDVAHALRPDAHVGTGRSDFPNQVNNVLCFPYIFRGALDVGASVINLAMKQACVDGLIACTQEQGIAYASGEKAPLLPDPFHKSLLPTIAPRVAKAAMETSVALRPLSDLEKYQQFLILT
jgi:malate dehydrogenase (oxaloacetate-decarboxylating)(NADP+)